jgi:putative ABC transport system permease protein
MNLAGSSTSGYFTAGGLLLAGFLLVSLYLVTPRSTLPGLLRTVPQLSLRNISRNPKRSFSIIALFSLGTFIVVATGANRRDLSGGADKLSSGTGGFAYFAESTIPVLHNLNDPGIRRQYGLEGNYDFVQFRKNRGDDASCLNLNRISNPAILGADPRQLEGRFSFVAGTEDLDNQKPWMTLQQSLPGGVIPAIADQTVIQWGLGMKVGDTLTYKDATGDTLMLKLVGGLAASVFQGYVIISDEHFLDHFPASSGSEVFLINPYGASQAGAEEELRMIFRDYGWRMNRASDRLAEFYSVENTYLSIFLMLGVLSLLLGTVGLGIVLARSIMERRSEIGLLQAIGYGSRHIYSIIFIEYIVLLAAGILTGFLAAVVATLPSLLSATTDVSLTNLAVILAFLLLNALIWIGLFTRISVGRNLISHLRYE